MDQEHARKLGQRAGLGRLVSLIANEGLVNITFNPLEGQYALTPLQQDKHELLKFSGRKPLLAQVEGVRGDGSVVPAIVIESDITQGSYTHQCKNSSAEPWNIVNDDVQPDEFVHILRLWNNWDENLTMHFAARLRSSHKYLTEAYLLQRPCPTLDSDWITWEQSVVEGNLHPLHKCRMSLNPKSQSSETIDFNHPDVAFFAVDRNCLTVDGPLEAELRPLLDLAGVDASSVQASELVVPVHEIQVESLLALPSAKDRVRLLPQRIESLAQSSTRTVTVPGVPGVSFKLCLSMIIGDTDRHIKSKVATAAVQLWASGMLDHHRLEGLRVSGLEIIPEVAGATGFDDRLGVLIRREDFRARQASGLDDDVTYIMAGALGEAAVMGATQRVAESIFGLTTRRSREDFFRNYSQRYLETFLPPLLINGIRFYAHGQNAILKVSRSTKRLLGFALRDLGDTKIWGPTFELSTGLAIPDAVEKGLEPTADIQDLIDGAYRIFFVVHLLPLMVALRLDHRDPALMTDTLNGPSIDGIQILRQELDRILRQFEIRSDIATGANSAQTLVRIARQSWLERPTWPMQAMISQRMRADWSHRDRRDELSRVQMCNVLCA